MLKWHAAAIRLNLEYSRDRSVNGLHSSSSFAADVPMQLDLENIVLYDQWQH